MYCKYCGKQIDEDSSFCKHCENNLEVTTNPSDNYIGFFKRNFVVIALVIAWYIFGFFYSLTYYDNWGIIFGMYLVTPILYGVLYWLYTHYCNYPIRLFDKSDSSWMKWVKYAYLIYTIIIPFACSDGLGEEYFIYFVILGIVWLVPTLIICGLYYLDKSRKR